MRIHIILTVFLSLLNFSTCFAQNNRLISDEEVLDTAKANLDWFIGRIDGSYKDFGFNSKEEMNDIQLGAPYEVVFLSSEFVADSVFIEGKNYFVKDNYAWNVPLIVDNTIRCIQKVIYHNDTLRATGGGGAHFCQFIDRCEKQYTISEDGKRYLLLPEIIYQCEFIMLHDDLNNTSKLYPVRKDIEGYECTIDVSYNNHNSVEDFFNTYKTKIYTSTIDKINFSGQFELYPNPIKYNGIIKGIIPQSILKADIKIFDYSGKVLFDNRIKDRGFIKIDINNEIFPNSGIYFYRITLDGISITEKLIVMN